MTLPLRDWQKGQWPGDASHLNEVINAVRAMLGSQVFGGVDPGVVETGYAVITDKGPKKEKDWTDERYWIKPVYLTAEDPDGDDVKVDSLVKFSPEPDRNSYVSQRIVVAVNLAEMGRDKDEAGLDKPEKGVHLLRVGEHVRYFGLADAAKPAHVHYFFTKAPPPAIVALAGTVSDKKGKVSGTSYGGGIQPNDTDLSEDQLGTFSSTADKVIWDANAFGVVAGQPVGGNVLLAPLCGLIPVDLSVAPGGNNGNDSGTTGPDFGYTAKTKTGVSIPGTFAPAFRPFQTGKIVNPASEGVGYWAPGGGFTLLFANEQWQRGPCGTGG